MGLLILFWFVRISCIAGFIVNLVVIDVHNPASFAVFVAGMAASINIYFMGLVAHETYRSLPSIFILFRLIQFGLIFATKCISLQYMALYAGIDLFVFVIFVIDNKYFKFILVPADHKQDKTEVRFEE
jgi:hypothetical protein